MDAMVNFTHHHHVLISVLSESGTIALASSSPAYKQSGSSASSTMTKWRRLRWRHGSEAFGEKGKVRPLVARSKREGPIIPHLKEKVIGGLILEIRRGPQHWYCIEFELDLIELSQGSLLIYFQNSPLAASILASQAKYQLVGAKGIDLNNLCFLVK